MGAYFLIIPVGIPDSSAGKESICNAGDTGGIGLIPGWGRFPGALKKWQLIPLFLLEISHGQRSLAGVFPRDEKSQTRLKRLSTNAYICINFFRFFSLKNVLPSIEYGSLF